ncbi:hypothetical protein J6TS2_37140 [Heyndrickxia sporothermodurans]|nr:hypothetical protein J6TS2_37140 [Heyndrickxia sporothermodurans]
MSKVQCGNKVEWNVKKVLDVQEFNNFKSLLKDIANYQLKIDQANGCTEILDKVELRIYQQL